MIHYVVNWILEVKGFPLSVLVGNGWSKDFNEIGLEKSYLDKIIEVFVYHSQTKMPVCLHLTVNYLFIFVNQLLTYEVYL